MSGYIDHDAERVQRECKEMVCRAIAGEVGHKADEPFLPVLEGINGNQKYIWERQAMEAFRRFWDDPANWNRFKREFFRGEELLYREDMVGDDFHLFPAPGQLFGEDTFPEWCRDASAALVFSADHAGDWDDWLPDGRQVVSANDNPDPLRQPGQACREGSRDGANQTNGCPTSARRSRGGSP